MARWLILATLVPSAALAEGAPQTLDCHATLACDDAGACQASDARWTFVFSPVDVESNGSGKFMIQYGDVSRPMTSTSAIGPFFWSASYDERDALLVARDMSEEGSVTMLWHRFRFSTGRSELSFLTCEVTL